MGNPQEELFGKERLLDVLRATRGASAQEIQEAVLGAVHEFAGDSAHAQHDDITLMVLVRGRPQSRSFPDAWSRRTAARRR